MQGDMIDHVQINTVCLFSEGSPCERQEPRAQFATEAYGALGMSHSHLGLCLTYKQKVLKLRLCTLCHGNSASPLGTFPFFPIISGTLSAAS
jgi:hypothetical protein